MITKRAVWLAVFCAFATVLSWQIGIHGPIFLLFNLIWLCLIIIDFILLPKKTKLKVARENIDNDNSIKLYFKSNNDCLISIRNDSDFELLIEVKDEDARHFEALLPNPRAWVKPGERVNFNCITHAKKRGSFDFSKIYVRFSSVLGLAVKYVVYDIPVIYKVYPNLKDLSKYRLLVQKNKSLPQGNKSISLLGMGAEFESLRLYVPGDDYRKINWPATARENKLIVNNYEIERNQPVFIMLDIGRSMSYIVNGYKKLDFSINAALILCDIVNQQGDNTGLVVYDSQVRHFIKPGKGALHRNHFMESLYRVEDNRQMANSETAFFYLCEKQKRRSIVFIFTDFEIMEEAEELIANITWLKRRHKPIVIFMANHGLDSMADSYGVSRKRVVLRDTAREFRSERQDIFRKLNAMGVPNIESSADRFALVAVNEYLRLRR